MRQADKDVCRLLTHEVIFNSQREMGGAAENRQRLDVREIIEALAVGAENLQRQSREDGWAVPGRAAYLIATS